MLRGTPTYDPMRTLALLTSLENVRFITAFPSLGELGPRPEKQDGSVRHGITKGEHRAAFTTQARRVIRILV